MKTRSAKMQISIAGADASSEVGSGLINCTWTDQASGKADNLTLTLEDRDKLWQGSWMPDKGDALTASIITSHWFSPGQQLAVPCGNFEIDEVECSGPPDVVRIKATSTAVSSTLRREKKTKSWENTTLQAVLSDIAGKNGLSPLYEASAITLKRVDQREQSDLAFLSQQAKKYGLNLKVSDTQLILYAGATYDAKSPVATLTRGTTWINTWSFRTQAGDQFKACECTYWDPEAKQEIKQTFSAPNEIGSGQTLKINERLASLAEAKTVAQNRLRQMNKQEVEGAIGMGGHPSLLAGCTVEVSGYGNYDGSYFIEQATHSVSRGQGYTTQISIRKTLSY